MRKNQKYTQKSIVGGGLKRRRGINRGVDNKNILIIFTKRNKRLTEESIKTLSKDISIFKSFNIISKLPLPNKVITQKGILVRMGKGKGKIKTKVLNITPGQILFELIPISNSSGVSKTLFFKFFRKYTFLGMK